MIEKLKRISDNPATKEALQTLKPQKSIWGITSVILLFIIPEIIAFIWGADISAFCDKQLLLNLPLEEEYGYKGVKMFLGEGSYFNLFFGFGLLIWLFF